MDLPTNPFGDDPDFQYLALDRKKMMEEMPAFDAKTSCWIVDAKEGYAKANIKSTKGDDVTVITEEKLEVFFRETVQYIRRQSGMTGGPS